MITIDFEFPIKKDAYIFRNHVNNFLSGSFFETESQIVISPIKKVFDDKRDCWIFTVTFRKDANDNSITEKYTKISGGTLDLFNGSKQVWAFA